MISVMDSNSAIPQTGDVFQLTYGYDATNVHFFQIKDVKQTKTGKYSAHIVQVVPSPLTVTSSTFSGDSYIGTLTRKPLPLDKYHTFVKDNIKGDRKIIHIHEYPNKPGYSYISFDVGLAFHVPFTNETNDKTTCKFTTTIY